MRLCVFLGGVLREERAQAAFCSNFCLATVRPQRRPTGGKTGRLRQPSLALRCRTEAAAWAITPSPSVEVVPAVLAWCGVLSGGVVVGSPSLALFCNKSLASRSGQACNTTTSLSGCRRKTLILRSALLPDLSGFPGQLSSNLEGLAVINAPHVLQCVEVLPPARPQKTIA